MKFNLNFKLRGLLPSRFACHLPPGGRLCCRPTVHLKGVTHYTLQSKACEKEYEQNCSYSFCYFFGKCCPLRVILSGVRPRFHLRFARCCFAVRLRYASLRMTRRTQSKPEGRTAMPFGSRRDIKSALSQVALRQPFYFLFNLLFSFLV